MKVEIHITGAEDEQLSLINSRLEQIMGRLDEQKVLISELNTYTNSLAEEEEKQTAIAEEIRSDLDALLAEVTDTTVTAELTALRDKAATLVSGGTAMTETLRNIAAKHEQPLPPPVEPEPTPEEPPVA